MIESKDPSGPDQAKQALVAELILPLMALAFAAYYLSTVGALRWQVAATGVGISTAMAVVAACLFVRFARDFRAGRSNLGLGDLVHPWPIFLRRVFLFAAGVGLVALMPLLGFTTCLFAFLVVAITGLAGIAKLRQAVVIAAVVALSGYLVFVVLVGARFPHGPFEHFVRAMMG